MLSHQKATGSSASLSITFAASLQVGDGPGNTTPQATFTISTRNPAAPSRTLQAVAVVAAAELIVSSAFSADGVFEPARQCHQKQIK